MKKSSPILRLQLGPKINFIEYTFYLLKVKNALCSVSYKLHSHTYTSQHNYSLCLAPHYWCLIYQFQQESLRLLLMPLFDIATPYILYIFLSIKTKLKGRFENEKNKHIHDQHFKKLLYGFQVVLTAFKILNISPIFPVQASNT